MSAVLVGHVETPSPLNPEGIKGAVEGGAELAYDVRHDLELVKDRSEALVLGAAAETLRRQALLSPRSGRTSCWRT